MQDLHLLRSVQVLHQEQTDPTLSRLSQVAGTIARTRRDERIRVVVPQVGWLCRTIITVQLQGDDLRHPSLLLNNDLTFGRRADCVTA